MVENKKENQKEQEEEEISVEELVEVESGSTFDAEEHEGKKVELEGAKVIMVNSKFDENGEKLPGEKTVRTPKLKVFSKPVESIESKDKGTIEIRASELFSMKKDEEGKWGISDSPNSNFNKFCKKYGIPLGLEGVKAINNGSESAKMKATGTDSNFLGFMY